MGCAELAKNLDGKFLPKEVAYLEGMLQAEHPTLVIDIMSLSSLGWKQTEKSFWWRWEMRSARQKKLLTGKMVEHFVTLG